MKKSILLLSTVMIAGASFSQTIFSENFDAAAAMPAGWSQQNVDGLTVATNLSAFNFGTNAWVFRANDVTGAGNHAVSTSWYSPAGTADDWLITPQIAIPATGNYFFQFDAMGADANYPDGFKIYVSTTGNAVANFGTTAILTQAAAATTYTNYSASLAAYAGQNVYIAIRNNSTDMNRLNVDNVVVRQPAADDAVLNSASLNRYSAVSINNTLGLTVKNDGNNAITSLTVNWNDGADHSSVITTNIAAGATATINHPVAISYATALEKTIAVTITNVNGNADPNPANNAATKMINTVSQILDKNVVIEEGTGTWCGWCPRGAVAMEYMTTNYPVDFIGIAVHNDDPMTVTAYDAGANLSGFPGCNVDRALLDQGVSQAAFLSYYNARKDLVVPAGIAVTSTIAGSAVTLNVASTFVTPFAASNYRLGVIITEDNVTGTTAAYNQNNYYANNANGAMGGFESLPASVPAAQMVYDHVGRSLLGGYTGQASSVPAAITDGQVVNYTFNYTVPGTSNISNMHAVAVLIDQSNGEIVNAKSISLASAGISESADALAMQVYPNPATDVVNVKFEGQGGTYTVAITDLSGREMGTSTVMNANGAQTVALDVNGLAGGNYLVTIATEGVSYTQQVVVR